MAAKMPASVLDEQQRVLKLLQADGNAMQAIAVFASIPLVAHTLSNPRNNTNSDSIGVELLRHVFNARLQQARDAKRSAGGTKLSSKINANGSSKEQVKQTAVFAAKVAQTVIKTYASASDQKSVDDVASAMDLASAALYVVWTCESILQLGDLVMESMLYQVAKKYTDIPKGKPSAVFVVACVHLRLWNLHDTMCEKLRQKCTDQSKILQLLQSTSSNTISIAHLAHVAEFPTPQSFHTLQFTRVVIGLINTCITLLQASKQYEAILAVADKTLAVWIKHLTATPGVDVKLVTSFNDRAFRMLWKCASTTEEVKMKEGQSNLSLQFRSVALSFMVKCTQYSVLYMIQQVYRVGVQFEKSSKRSSSDYKQLFHFYAQTAAIVRQKHPHSDNILKSEKMEWGYLLWLEHVASVCEGSLLLVESVAVLEVAIQYLQSFEGFDALLPPLWLVLAGSLLGLECDNSGRQARSRKDVIGNFRSHQQLLKSSNPMVNSLLQMYGTDRMPIHCENEAQTLFKKIGAFDISGTDLQHKDFVSFHSRCVKKSATKLYNYIVLNQTSTKQDLLHQIISSFTSICTSSKKLRSGSNALNSLEVETMLLNEARLYRMVVVLLARTCIESSESCMHISLALISQHAKFVQMLLDDFIDGDPKPAVWQHFLGELNLIARECFNCASRFYRKNLYRETILALTDSFELAESYLEYVMCNASFTAKDVHNAHIQLKVDSIASLLAYCFHEKGELLKARTFTGHSILYWSNVGVEMPYKNVEKYVTSILEELCRKGDHGCKDVGAVVDDFKQFINNTIHAYKARHIPEPHIVELVRTFRRCFDQMSTKILNTIRAWERKMDEPMTPLCDSADVKLCVEIENWLDEQILKSNDKCEDPVIYKSMMSICGAITNRKLCYSTYYLTHDPVAAIKDLMEIYDQLSDGISNLKQQTPQKNIDLGGACAWRGITIMEIALLSSYSTSVKLDGVDHQIFDSISEEDAVTDIRQCLAYWEHIDAISDGKYGYIFDVQRVISSLEAVCSSLSLISCPVLEKSTRALLETLQANHPGNLPLTLPPPSLHLLTNQTNTTFADVMAGISGLDESDQASHSAFIVCQRIDAEITFDADSLCIDNPTQACQHLLNANIALNSLKSKTMKTPSSLTTMKALALRELLVHLRLSEVYFNDGQVKQAISEAKAALSLCWKLAKKFALSSTVNDNVHFELPDEIKKDSNSDSHLQASSLLYFKALEFSSWDILHAAKLLLCRIASLYSFSGQPHRANMYYVEAMQLVGGLNLRFFHRSPFYDYAKLQLHSDHCDRAMIAMNLISPSHDVSNAKHSNKSLSSTQNAHSCFFSDPAFIEQKCNELIHDGDIRLMNTDIDGALSSYFTALSTITADGSRISTLKTIRRTHARCWRKVTKARSGAFKPSQSQSVEELLSAMKNLKQTMELCEDRLEKVKCMLELAQSNMTLLRSVSTRHFMSLERTIVLLEQAFALGNPLGIAHLCQKLQLAMGVAYVMENDTIEDDVAGRNDENTRSQFLSWASASLLSNCSAIEHKINCPMTANSAEQTLTAKLETLVSNVDKRAKLPPHESMKEMVESISRQVADLHREWMIISITIGISSEVIITRISATDSIPVSFCLRDFRWEKHIHEMERIIQASRETLSGHTAEETVLWDAERKKGWWNSRKELDERLGQAIQSLQTELGFWRCLFLKTEGVTVTELTERCWMLLISNHNLPIKFARRNQSLLSAMVNARTYLSEEEIVTGLKHIAADIGISLSEKSINKILRIVRGNCQEDTISSDQSITRNQTGAIGGLTEDDINKMKVEDMKDHLSVAGLSTQGSKKELVNRLLAARNAALFRDLNTVNISHRSSRHEGAEGSTGHGCAVILVLDQKLQEFPWEGLDIFQHCHGVTRMPSLDLILRNARQLLPDDAAISSNPMVHRQRVRYLLNPAGDLKSTQKHLGPVLGTGTSRFGWNGIIGRIPQSDELRHYLLNSDLFIYCGHGSGEKYFHREKILGLQRGCSAALLFGCSSGRLDMQGIFGPNGAVLSYLRAGSPAVLAMLWDVTDKDIDQLSMHVLEKWLLAPCCEGKQSRGRPLAGVLRDARQACKLKYLNGHAAVCYGLPLYVVDK